MIGNNWICSPEIGEPDDGPWEIYRVIEEGEHLTFPKICLLAYGLTEESARTIAQRLND